jgi:hypothetical protein
LPEILRRREGVDRRHRYQQISFAIGEEDVALGLVPAAAEDPALQIEHAGEERLGDVALVEPDDLRVAAGLVAQLERARLARKLEYHCGDLCLRVAPGKYEAKPRGDKRRAMRQQGHVCLLNQAAVNCAFEGLDLSSNLAEAFPKLS